MKSATEVLKVLPNQPAGAVLPTARRLDPEAVKIVNELFVELTAIFPAWRQAWPDKAAMDRAKRSWVKGFIKAQIRSIDQIRYGVEACRELGEDFAPSVGKFVRMCVPKPADLGLPTEDAAWAEAIRGCADPTGYRWSHEAVHLAGRAVGWFLLRNGGIPEEALRKRFGNAYHQLLRRLSMGLPLEEPRQALEDMSEGKELTPEQAEREGERVVQHLLRVQGLAGVTGEQARQQLLDKMGLKRNGENRHG